MYNLENIQAENSGHRNMNFVPAFRMLLQNTQGSPTDEPLVSSGRTETGDKLKTNDDGPTGKQVIHINGTGVAGISVAFVFLIPVLIGCSALMSIFVSTKFIDQPLKIKITE